MARQSPEGIKKFGEWVANRLMIAGGAVFVLILAPSMVEGRPAPAAIVVPASAFMLLATGAALAIFYFTVVREVSPAAGGDE